MPLTTEALSVPICAPPAGAEEEKLVLEVLRSGRLVSGPKVEQFEAACASMADTSEAIAVSNGTASLELILEGLGIGQGDEVITTAFTFVATVSAIVRSGATARIVDITRDNTIDLDAVAAAINPRTVAVLPVHLFGQPADLVRLEKICAQHGLALIEDAAQAHGAAVNGRAVGGWGHGSFSFYATKSVSCGEGGVVTTNDSALAHKLRLLRNQGMDKRYSHELVGGNRRMSELHAAVGLPSMARLSEINTSRRRNALFLREGLADVNDLDLPFEVSGRDHVWHQFTVLSEQRDLLAAELAKSNIQTGIYYPMPVNEQPAYKNHDNVVSSDCEYARLVSRRCLSLPVHDRLSTHQLEYVVSATRRALAGT